MLSYSTTKSSVSLGFSYTSKVNALSNPSSPIGNEEGKSSCWQVVRAYKSPISSKSLESRSLAIAIFWNPPPIKNPKIPKGPP